MNYKQLQAMGAIVPRTLFKREVPIKYRPLKPENEWAEPGNPEHQEDEVEDSITVFIRKASAADVIEILSANPRDMPFVGIHRCICNEDGTELFPDLESAGSLAIWMATALFDAVKSVNPDTAKKSKARMSSGANSPSPSAAKRSHNSKRNSRQKKPASGNSTAPSAAP